MRNVPNKLSTIIQTPARRYKSPSSYPTSLKHCTHLDCLFSDHGKFDIRPRTAPRPTFQTPPFKNLSDTPRGPWNVLHVEYLFILIRKAVEDVSPRRLFLEDFIAIAEAMHRYFQSPANATNITYPIRGVNAIHTYAIKHCKKRFWELQAKVDREQIRKREGAAGTSSSG